jgi:hypothetical protein
MTRKKMPLDDFWKYCSPQVKAIRFNCLDQISKIPVYYFKIFCEATQKIDTSLERLPIDLGLDDRKWHENPYYEKSLIGLFGKFWDSERLPNGIKWKYSYLKNVTEIFDECDSRELQYVDEDGLHWQCFEPGLPPKEKGVY